MDCDKFGQTISTKITEEIQQKGPGNPNAQANIAIKDNDWRNVQLPDQHSLQVADEVNSRFTKASAAIDQLNRNVWNRRGVSEATIIKVYRAVVLKTLIYGSETWITYQRHI